MSQIIIGIIVTVVGTVIANAIVRGGGGKHFFGGSYFRLAARRPIATPSTLPSWPQVAA